MSSAGLTTDIAAPAGAKELQSYWPAILACFVTAVFAWGFGFYGQSLYVAELRRINDWPASLAASAATCMYLTGAVLLTVLHRALDRLGARLMLGGGAVILGAGAVGLSWSSAPWQLFGASLIMAVGWSATTTTAIATTLALWFDQRRGLAISLALNGASVSGFTVLPALAGLTHHVGLGTSVPVAVAVALAVILPVVVLGIGRIGPATAQRRSQLRSVGPEVDSRPVFTSNATALRDRLFWSVALPFALALAAQVGFIVHEVSFLLPRLGVTGAGLAVGCTSFAAMAGRLGLGFVIDRLNQRLASAISFASQAGGLGLMLAMPHSATALYAGCIVFGFSVGNVITFPSLIIQREFAAASFGLIMGLSSAVGQFTLALGPALLGLVRDATGGYFVAVCLCITLQLVAAVLVLHRSR
jgi:MFS family permease